MNCRECENLTADYLGDELEPQPRQNFESHLETCADCAKRVAALAQTAEALERLPTVGRTEAQHRTCDLQIVRQRPLWVRTGLSLLKTAAVLAIGVWLGRSSAGPTEVKHQSPRVNDGTLVAKAESLHPDWLKLARDSGSQRSTLAGQLAILAKSRR